VTFGLKLAQAYAEFDRCKDRLLAARADIATCALSGAVGTFANIDPRSKRMSPRQDGANA
jgi:adenylosuccinate lyase